MQKTEPTQWTACPTWNKLINEFMQTPEWDSLKSFLQKEESQYRVYPKKKHLFNAFKLSSYDHTNVVILGQDPYHSPDTAHGLAFSSLQPETPPSLRNVYQEIYRDCYSHVPKFKDVFATNDLTFWAEQGVLLLNTILTVRERQPLSHAGQGWEEFTSRVLYLLAQRKKPLVFMLWGQKAQNIVKEIDLSHHLVLTAGHPSPLSVKNFIGCSHFSICNRFLLTNYGRSIWWYNTGDPLKNHYTSHG